MPYKFIEDERAQKKRWWAKNKHRRKEYKRRWALKRGLVGMNPHECQGSSRCETCGRFLKKTHVNSDAVVNHNA